MAGIDFDRQSFIKVEQPPRRSSMVPIVGLLAAALGVSGAVYLGYKLISSAAPSAHTVDAQAYEELQQELAEMDKRIDSLEKHRKPAPIPEPIATVQKPESSAPVPARHASYKIKAASAFAPLIAVSHESPVDSKPQVSQQDVAVVAAETAANREAWQATTDRLADVVGVVGSQQGELSQTREDVNKILAKTVRSAIPFELRRGAAREPVGPVSLVLKNADAKSQRYTVCVYLEDQCIELKNRGVNEVVAFVLSDKSAPLELVATKILHDQIVGYLAVPGASRR